MREELTKAWEEIGKVENKRKLDERFAMVWPDYKKKIDEWVEVIKRRLRNGHEVKNTFHVAIHKKDLEFISYFEAFAEREGLSVDLVSDATLLRFMW